MLRLLTASWVWTKVPCIVSSVSIAGTFCLAGYTNPLIVRPTTMQRVSAHVIASGFDSRTPRMGPEAKLDLSTNHLEAVDHRALSAGGRLDTST